MTEAEELQQQIDHHREMLEYEQANYRRGVEVKSYNSAERSLAAAAYHAAIFTALSAIAAQK